MSEAGDAEALRAAQLLELGRPEEALEHLSKGLASDPESLRLLCLASQAHLKLGDTERAAELALAAIVQEPEEEWGHRLLALALHARGKKREARQAAEEAVRLDPEEPLAYVVLSHTLAGSDEAGSLAAISQAVTLNPEDASSRASLGDVLLRNDRHQEAAEHLRYALHLDPEDAEAENNLAVAHLRMGNRAEADAGFERAAKLDPTLGVARENIIARRGGWIFALRRVTVGMVLLLIVGAATQLWDLVGIAVAIGVLSELVRLALVMALPERERSLIRDDTAARRFSPRRWDWSWPTRLRPWWWVLLMQLPPPLMVAGNLAVLALAAVSLNVVFGVIALLALPFSVRRVWRWWRLTHPSKTSWRPPAS